MRIPKDLNITFSDLNLELSSSPFILKHLRKLEAELAKKKVNFKPHFWVSDEWFVPDGVTGIAVPFYALNSTLKKIQASQGLTTEGSTDGSIMKFLRHETAHALDNAFHLRKSKKRQALFGLSSTPYPEFYKPTLNKKSYVHNLGENYAEAHPDEDWAETFAVWLDPKSDWKKKYKNTKAFEKLMLVDELIKTIQNKKPKHLNHTTPFNFSNKQITLSDYYLNKKKEVLKKRSHLNPMMKKLFSADRRCKNLSAESFLKSEALSISKTVSKSTGHPPIKVRIILKELALNSKIQSLNLKESKKATKKQMIALLNQNFTSYDLKGYTSIMM